MRGGKEHGRAEAAVSSRMGAASRPRARLESSVGERERMPLGEQGESECMLENGGERVGVSVHVGTTVIYYFMGSFTLPSDP